MAYISSEDESDLCETKKETQHSEEFVEESKAEEMGRVFFRECACVGIEVYPRENLSAIIKDLLVPAQGPLGAHVPSRQAEKYKVQICCSCVVCALGGLTRDRISRSIKW